MGDVTTLPRGRPYTGADLETMPDDGRRYEVVDGALLVTPSPSLRHQWVSSNLIKVLQAAAPHELRVLHAPLDLVLDEATVLQPDLLVVPAADLKDPDQPLRPRLVVEILSPATRTVDLTLKRSRYETAQIGSYWVVDPHEPSITAWQLVDERYVDVGHAEGDELFEVAVPFTVRLCPADLLT